MIAMIQVGMNWDELRRRATLRLRVVELRGGFLDCRAGHVPGLVVPERPQWGLRGPISARSRPSPQRGPGSIVLTHFLSSFTYANHSKTRLNFDGQSTTLAYEIVMSGENTHSRLLWMPGKARINTHCLNKVKRQPSEVKKKKGTSYP